MEIQKVFLLVAIILVATTEARYFPRQNRIYGGHEAEEGQFPYHVLVTRSLGGGAVVICGGAIISSNYVVTAAHCANDSLASDFLVRAGTVQFNSGGALAPVAEVKIHPEYSEYNFDIALLRLNTSFEFSDKIKAIPLASTIVPEGSPVIITGFGGIENGSLSDRLLYNTEEALNHDTCIDRLNTLADSMRCLGKEIGNGVCSGDSGGPAAYDGKLIGVASFVVNGCGSELPNGFTDVLAARDWIYASTDVDHRCST